MTFASPEASTAAGLSQPVRPCVRASARPLDRLTVRRSDRRTDARMHGRTFPTCSGRTGFTLVEVLITAVILAVGLTVLLTSLSTCLGVMKLARLYDQVEWTLGLGELTYPEPFEASKDVEKDYTVDPDSSLAEGFTFERSVDKKTPEEEEKDKLFVVRTRVTWGEGGDEGVQAGLTGLDEGPPRGRGSTVRCIAAATAGRAAIARCRRRRVDGGGSGSGLLDGGDGGLLLYLSSVSGLRQGRGGGRVSRGRRRRRR